MKRWNAEILIDETVVKVVARGENEKDARESLQKNFKGIQKIIKVEERDCQRKHLVSMEALQREVYIPRAIH